MNTPIDVTKERTSFDMRLEYYQGIGELWRACNMFVSLGDFESWHRGLTMLVNMHPFISKEQLSTCDEALNKAKNYLSLSSMPSHSAGIQQQRQFYRIQAIAELNKVHRLVVRLYQEHDMLLPKKNGDEEKNDAAIAKEMGL